MKVILTLQGGGALGAFECGVYKVLEPWLKEQGHTLEVVAGVSIGAINASLIAHQYAQNAVGSDTLEKFWLNELARPSLPFNPYPNDYCRSWNGLLTGLLCGNSSLFAPAYWNWNLIGEASRFRMPLYSTEPMRQTLRRLLGTEGYTEHQPLLVVRALEVETGQPRIFNSAKEAITPEVVSASAAIPILFEPGEFDGRHYWDGEIWNTTLIRDVMRQIRKNDNHPPGIEDYLLIMVNTFKPSETLTPISAMQASYRLENILQSEKAHYDLHLTKFLDEHTDFVSQAYQAAQDLPSGPLKDLLDAEYMRLVNIRRSRLDIMLIERADLPNDHISRSFDYSPERIRSLIRQGEEAAQRAITQRAVSKQQMRSSTPPAIPTTQRSNKRKERAAEPS